MVKNQDGDLDINLVMRGIQDVLNGVKPSMSQEEIQENRPGLRGAERAQKMQSMAQTNMEEGQAFLEKNKKFADFVTCPAVCSTRS